MKNKFYVGEKAHSLADIKKHNSRIVYWVVFPQGIIKKRKGYTVSSNMMIAKTRKRANKLVQKYHGAIVQKCIECDFGRWILEELWDSEYPGVDYDTLWNIYKEKYRVIQL
jgi:hypothetical protein